MELFLATSNLFKSLICQSPVVTIMNSSNFSQPTMKKKNDLIDIVTSTKIKCSPPSNTKQWSIYRVNKLTGINEEQIQIKNNPTINYAELVLQPQTLSYGLFRFVYTVTMINKGPTNVSAKAETFILVIPSGLVLSTLKLIQPTFGGAIEINRGFRQKIQFDPFLFTYDIDSVVVISLLTFKYTCQVIDSNLPRGYPKIKNQTIYLNEMKVNSSLQTLNKCLIIKQFMRLHAHVEIRVTQLCL